MRKIKSDKYSPFSKSELIEILEKIPDYQVYFAAQELRDNAFTEQSDAYKKSIAKLVELKKKSASYSFSEINSFDNNIEKCEKKYEKLCQLCVKLTE